MVFSSSVVGLGAAGFGTADLAAAGFDTAGLGDA
jgi:hypothetical protein